MYTQALDGPVPTDFGSFPGVVPSNSSQISLTPVAHVAASMVAVSPKLPLTPASSLPLVALTPLMTTWRSAFVLQFPHARYSLPNVSTVKLEIVTVPAPLCWMTLSVAPVAPPPVTWALPLPLRVRASSQTAAHHTFWIVQDPSQWTPSI